MDLDDDISKALLKRALGYEFDEIVEEYNTDSDGNSILSKRKITKKFNPPDLNALRFLLEQQSGTDDFENMSDEQLLQERDRLLQLLKEKEISDENQNM